MIKLGLRLMVWAINDGSEGFMLIKRILSDRRLYPQHLQLNTRRLIHKALMLKLERGSFSDFHLNVFRRVANG